jgi:hypothetical protein
MIAHVDHNHSDQLVDLRSREPDAAGMCSHRVDKIASDSFYFVSHR